MKLGFFFLCFILLFSACTKDREIVEPNKPNALKVFPGVFYDSLDVFMPINHDLLKVNEFVARGSENANEFGETEDWFEIYNPSPYALILQKGNWFVTDKGPDDPMKYTLPQCTIPPRGFLLIWADGMDLVDQFIHTNFSLSASGEHIGIYYSDDTLSIMIDDYEYPPQEVPAVSTGRYPDGADNWIQFNTPTPGMSNN